MKSILLVARGFDPKLKKKKKKISRAWFRSTDLWVMGPARFHCATLLMRVDGKNNYYILFNSNLCIVFLIDVLFNVWLLCNIRPVTIVMYI